MSTLSTGFADRLRLMNGLRYVNGVYTQVFNRRHGKVGHLFLGRFKAILVDPGCFPAGGVPLRGAEPGARRHGG